MRSNIDHGHSVMKNNTPSSYNISQNSNLDEYEEKSIFTSENQIMDYITVKGIKNRTGVEKNHLIIFVLKELVDNALDFMEKYASDFNKINEKPKISITIIEDKENNLINIKVRNSNPGIDVFPEFQIKNIFDFNRFYSSKRHRHQISRGALGDALKEILCVPYALALENNNNIKHDYPLKINLEDRTINIRVNIDKIKQTVKSDIKIQAIRNVTNNNKRFIEIETTIPTKLYHEAIRIILLEYVVLNPHIEFYVSLPIFGKNKFPSEFKSIQNIKKWSNYNSIYYYSLTDFRNLILTIEDNTPVFNLLKSFREGTNITIEKTITTVGQLKYNDKKIIEIYNKLRSIMCPRQKLELSFDTNKKNRLKVLEERLEQYGFVIENSRYKIIQGYVKSDNGIEYPYIIEIAIFHPINAFQNLTVIQGVNCSGHIYYPFYNTEYTFSWQGDHGKINSASSVMDILERYGYSINEEKHRKSKSIVVVNLISPKIDYKNYGKSSIDLTPFSKDIAENIYNICKLDTRDSSNSGDNNITIKNLLTKLLYKRLKNVEENPELKKTDRWTQSTVFYRLRPILLDNNVQRINRKYITNIIREICIEKFNKKREELGIIAADRAQLYFRGKSFDVGIDEISDLMGKGTDLIIIEKEGVSEVLTPFAEKYGIALLNTRGFLTEYTSDLSRYSKISGANVVILTDLDISGLLLAKKVPAIPRIGIDFKTIEYFSLNPDNIKEKYDPPEVHLKALEDMSYSDYDLKKLLPFVTQERIEIDSVIAQVGNENFWNFLVSKLQGRFKTRDYNRAINIPTELLPKEVENFIDKLGQKITKITEHEHEKIKNELKNTEGFITDVEVKEKEIEDRLRDFISKNKDIDLIISEINKIKI